MGDWRTRWAASVLLALLACGVTPAQTFNGLRDPQREVFRLYPAADAYRAIVREVDRDARKQVEQKLLPIRVHRDELGPHTLYVAYRGRRPLGLIYVRTEEGEWGLTEIAWAVDLDLEIGGFWFLSGRSRFQSALQGSAFARQLVGRGYQGLRELLADDGGLGAATAGVPPGAERLAAVVLRSSLKTVLVTDAVWRGEVRKLRQLALGLDAFPAAERVRAFVLDLRPLDEGQPGLLSGSGVKCTDRRGVLLGLVVETKSRDRDQELALRWTLRPDGSILQVTPTEPWAGKRLRAACRELEGRRLSGTGTGSALSRRLASELAAVLQPARPGGR